MKSRQDLPLTSQQLTLDRRITMKRFKLTPENFALHKRVNEDMQNILKDNNLTLTEKLDQLEWRWEFVKEFCFE